VNVTPVVKVLGSSRWASFGFKSGLGGRSLPCAQTAAKSDHVQLKATLIAAIWGLHADPSPGFRARAPLSQEPPPVPTGQGEPRALPGSRWGLGFFGSFLSRSKCLEMKRASNEAATKAPKLARNTDARLRDFSAEASLSAEDADKRAPAHVAAQNGDQREPVSGGWRENPTGALGSSERPRGLPVIAARARRRRKPAGEGGRPWHTSILRSTQWPRGLPQAASAT
jgi:hypothetical protein